MDLIIFVFIAFICINVAVKIFKSEERNKVFNKRPIEVADVKKISVCVALEERPLRLLCMQGKYSAA